MKCKNCTYWSPEEMAKDHNRDVKLFTDSFGYCMANINDNYIHEKVFVPFHPPDQDLSLNFYPIRYSSGRGKIKPFKLIIKQFYTKIHDYLINKFNVWRFKRHRRYIYTTSGYGCINFKKK